MENFPNPANYYLPLLHCIRIEGDISILFEGIQRVSWKIPRKKERRKNLMRKISTSINQNSKRISGRNSATCVLNLDRFRAVKLHKAWNFKKIPGGFAKEVDQSRDINPGEDCVDLISPRNFWQSAVFLPKKDAQNSWKPFEWSFENGK